MNNPIKYLIVIMIFALVGGLSKPAAAQDGGPLLIYELFHYVPQSELIPLGDPSGIGGTILEGDIELKGRFDFFEGGMSMGIFQATTQQGAKVLISMPFNEHGTIIIGWVKLTDEFGNSRVYGPGDSYFVQQGSVILWEQTFPIVQSSNFSYTSP